MSDQIVRPGPSLVRGATALEQQLGRYPYQWLFPGPSSKFVLQQDVIDANTGAAADVLVTSYTVSDGMRFVLRGVVVGVLNSTTWVEGSGALVFKLRVTSAGTRDVEFLNDFKTHVGTLESPYPILGRLEFEPNAILEWSFSNDGTVTDGIVFAHLVGHEYPQVEEAV